ncbi:MAG: hypothetical protein ACLQDM_23040 [Bradyrhizobium sp.]
MLVVVIACDKREARKGANGSRECAPDDRPRDEAIQTCFLARWIASLPLAMTRTSSRRTPGPTTTNIRGYAQLVLQLISKLEMMAMDPRVRGDDDQS